MKYKVLVMDDELSIRNVITAILEVLECNVDCVESGVEAIDKYKSAFEAGEPYELVILDLTVPEGMGGKDTVKELLQQWPDANVYVFSGYINENNKEDYEDWGFKGFLSKPFAVDELRDILEKLG